MNKISIGETREDCGQEEDGRLATRGKLLGGTFEGAMKVGCWLDDWLEVGLKLA
jgi:hypothetical protein